jgi:ribose transport system substrate-binding protein
VSIELEYAPAPESRAIVDIQGILGTNVAQDRDKGFTEEIAKHHGITVVATQPANFDRATALDVMTNVLQAHPDINGVYAANDEMAMGVLAALKAANLTNKVTLVGNDGIADALAAVNSGEMYASNAESAYALGQRVLDLAASILGGKTVDKNTVLEGELVTKDYIAAYAQHLTSIGATADVPPSLK